MTQNIQYLKNRIEAMSKEELVLVVYEEMLKTLRLIEESLKKNDLAAKSAQISHALEIISVLISFLNYEAGDLAFQLRSLYVYAMQTLTKVNVHNSWNDFYSVNKLFLALTSSWKEMLKSRNQNGECDKDVSQQPSKIMEMYG